MQRNNFDQSEAEKRVAAQISNEERISHAHVILSTQWGDDVTQRLVRAYTDSRVQLSLIENPPNFFL